MLKAKIMYTQNYLENPLKPKKKIKRTVSLNIMGVRWELKLSREQQLHYLISLTLMHLVSKWWAESPVLFKLLFLPDFVCLPSACT